MFIYKTVHAERAKIGYVLGFLVYGKVVGEFGWKVFLVDFLLLKNIKYGEYKHKRTRTNVFMPTEIPSVTIQRNVTAMRYRNDVTRSVLLLYIRADLGMMLA